ncbi:MAG: hypothetical protein O9343_18760 [Burkholderiaceae bacterium]|jgi:hypothetical protein|nr:DUF2841 domain-containing protein [Burkholderiaceae bacterium]MCZ8177217.1 hypothetical protein [Burkholderiaceae bacterium]
MPHDAQVNNRAVDSAVQPCPLLHYFSVALEPVDAASTKPAWWPADVRQPYGGVAVTVTLGGVSPAQTLNSRGRFRIDGIAGGSASVVIKAGFYDDVRAQLDGDRCFSP